MTPGEQFSHNLLSFVISGAVILASIGSVWFYAWIFNPGVTSGTVWWVGIIFGMIMNAQFDLDEEIEKFKYERNDRI